MKKYKVIVRPKAKTDVIVARKWYNQQQRGLAKQFTEDFKRGLLRLASNPMSFAVRYSEYRKANLLRFPYGIFFFVDEKTQTIYIMAVKHNAQDITGE